jgi:hypothetical protein
MLIANMKITQGWVVWVLAFCPCLSAADRTFNVVTNTAMVNHWPGPDGFIGTADDPVKASVAGIYSSPNAYGSYGYMAVSLGGFPPAGILPPNSDTITYLQGKLTLDSTSFVTNDIPLVKSLEFSGTELFPGHGPYTVTLDQAYGSQYVHNRDRNPFGYGLTTHYSFHAQFASGPAASTNCEVTGWIYWLEAKDFGVTVTNLNLAGDPLVAYVNQVALPLARSLEASSLLCGQLQLKTPGALPGTTGSFPALQGPCAFIAMEFANTGQSLRITSVIANAQGVRIQWVPQSGRQYAVESTDALTSPFASVATQLTATEYVDVRPAAPKSRFYRIRAE